MRKVTVGLIQLESELKQIDANLNKAVERIRDAAKQGAQIVCLPETFVTGYNLAVFGDSFYDMSEGLTGKTIMTLRALAKELQIYIVAPIALQTECTRPMDNAAVFINDDGEVQGVYRKNHLFGNEGEYFRMLGDYPVFDTKYGKVGVMICYDNNFPEPARILTLKGAELILMPAAWRINEQDIWHLMISAHACENTVFIGAANIYSKMDDLYLFGHSKLVDPRGRVLIEATEEKGDTLVYTIDLDDIYKMRNEGMPWLKDRHPEDYGEIVKVR